MKSCTVGAKLRALSDGSSDEGLESPLSHWADGRTARVAPIAKRSPVGYDRRGVAERVRMSVA
jgi:hypothetical protein